MTPVLLKRTLIMVGLAVPVVVLAFIGWSIRPLMPSGQTVQVERWQYGNYEFQIWQRKNNSLLEPFSTAMFVQAETNESWRAFSLGFQDRYARHFLFHQSGSRVEIFCGKKKVGEYDLQTDKYLRVGQTQAIAEGTTANPSHWW